MQKSDGRPTIIKAITRPFWGKALIMEAEAQLRRYALKKVRRGMSVTPRKVVPIRKEIKQKRMNQIKVVTV